MSSVAGPLSVRADDQDKRAWRNKHAGPGQTHQGEDPAGFHQRGLRGSELHPQTEDYWGNVNPIGHRACYDEGKRCAETLFFDYHRQFGLGIKVARIFNTYGPRMHPNDGRVVSAFVVSALRNQPIAVYGQGDQTRSFCFVDDLIEGLLALMKSPREFMGPVNLGNPVAMRIIGLAETVIKLTNSRSQIVFEPLPSDDPKRRQPDISLSREQLNWTPKTGLQDGLVRTIAYFDELLRVAN